MKRIVRHCDICCEGTQHEVLHEDKQFMKISCLTHKGDPITVEKSGEQLELFIDEKDHGKKEVHYCPICQKENWGRAKKKIEDEKLKIIHFNCFICEQKSEIILKK